MRCDECWWFWTGSNGTYCHNEMTNEEDRGTEGRYCPWFDHKDEPNEMEDPVDIWN